MRAIKKNRKYPMNTGGAVRMYRAMSVYLLRNRSTKELARSGQAMNTRPNDQEDNADPTKGSPRNEGTGISEDDADPTEYLSQSDRFLTRGVLPTSRAGYKPRTERHISELSQLEHNCSTTRKKGLRKSALHNGYCVSHTSDVSG